MPFLLRISCSSLALGTLAVKGWAEMPVEYTGTPLNVVMMLVGVFLLWRICWPAFVLGLGSVKVESEARWVSDSSRPNAEVQSLTSVLPVLFVGREGCENVCATSWGRDEDDEDEASRRWVLGALWIETLSLAGVLVLLRAMVCL